MSRERFVNDPGISQTPTWLRGGSGGGGGGGGSGGFSDIIKGIGSLFDQVEQRKNVDLANQISIEESERTSRLASSEASGPAKTNDPEGKEVERRWQAVQQGKLTQEQFYAWGSARMRTMINQNPERAYQIRETFKQVTGYDPDVKFREERERNINEQKSKAQKVEDQWNKDKEEAAKLGIPAQVILKGDSDISARAQIRAEVLNRQAQVAVSEREKKNLELNEARRTAGANDAFELANREIDTEINNLYSDSFKATVGFSFNDINKKIAAAQSDGRISPQEITEIRAMFAQFKQAAQVRVDKLLNTPFGDDKRSYAARIGDQNKIKQIRERAMGRINDIQEIIENKDTGLIGYNKAVIEAIEQSDQLQVLQSDAGRPLRELKAAVPREALGAYLSNPTNTLRLSEALKNIQLDSAQTVRIGRVATDINKGVNLRESLENNKHKDPSKHAQVTNRAIVGAAQQLLMKETTPEQAAKIAESLFSDKGGNFTENLNRASKQKVFESLSTPEVQSRIQELAKSNPTIAARYNSWLMATGSNILKQETDTIKEYMRPPQGLLERMSTGSRPLQDLAAIRFDGKRFVIDPLLDAEVNREINSNNPAFTFKNYSIRSWYDNAKQSVERINAVLGGILPVAVAAGEDPQMVVQALFSDPEILKVVRQAGSLVERPEEAGGLVDRELASRTPPSELPEEGPNKVTIGEGQQTIGDKAKGVENSVRNVVAPAQESARQTGRDTQEKVGAGLRAAGGGIPRPQNAIELPEEGADVSSLGASQEASKKPSVNPREETLKRPDSKTLRDSAQGTSPDAANPVRDVYEGRARNPVIEQHIRTLEDGGILAQAASEEALKDLSSVKERRLEQNGDNFAIRYRPSQRARQAFRNIDINKLEPSVRGLLDFISVPESGGDYNRMFSNLRSPKPLTQMTIGEVLDFQAGLRRSGAASTAAGRYQIIFKTLRGLVQELGIDENEVYNEQMQDRLAIRLMQKRGLDQFMKGVMDEDTFIRNLSMEWAGLPNVTGKSFYAGDGLNKSGVPIGQFRSFISRLRGRQGENQ